MRVVVVADRCHPERSAGETAQSVRSGWLQRAGHDEVEAYGLSDGSLGFGDALSSLTGATTTPVVVRGPDGRDVPAQIVLRELDGRTTAYLDTAEVAGRHLVDEVDLRDPSSLSSDGIGQLMLRARDLGASRMVLGVGPLASHDGGAGVLRALGAGEHLESLPHVARQWAGVSLTLAAASAEPLTGFHGISAALGSEFGVDGEVTQRLEERMGRFTEVVERHYPAPKDLISGTRAKRERVPAAGVGGGLGYALHLLGAQTEAGAAFVGRELGVFDRLANSLVVLVSHRYDWRTVHDGVVAETAKAALQVAAPSIVLADEVLVGRREGMSLGISGTYEIRPDEDFADLATRVARTWSPPRPT